MSTPEAVIWHDLECGGYTADLELWRELAAASRGPVLDIGAGTGRVTLELARAGHEVVALDRDPLLLVALAERAGELAVETVEADARDFGLGRRFELILAPMQTIQLLGGAEGRRAMLRCVRDHLAPGGLFAVAVTTSFQEFGGGGPLPEPDVWRRDAVVYASRPVAVRLERGRAVLERDRELIDGAGTSHRALDVIHLDLLTRRGLEQEGRAAGLRPRRARQIAETFDHVASTVVMLGG